jgi:hypothetical protein
VITVWHRALRNILPFVCVASRRARVNGRPYDIRPCQQRCAAHAQPRLPWQSLQPSTAARAPNTCRSGSMEQVHGAGTAGLLHSYGSPGPFGQLVSIRMVIRSHFCINNYVYGTVIPRHYGNHRDVCTRGTRFTRAARSWPRYPDREEPDRGLLCVHACSMLRARSPRSFANRVGCRMTCRRCMEKGA